MFLILEWVEKLFNEKIYNLRGLALFLIDKMYVDTRSLAAQALASSLIKNEDGGDNSIGQWLQWFA
jgi:hypothetical protein